MLTALLGRKIGMTQVFGDDGQMIPVTLVRSGPCSVMQVKTAETDGYSALQLGFEDKKRSRANNPETGHAKRAGVEPKKWIREVAWDGEGDYSLGDQVGVEIFNDIPAVDVIGTTKGKGFAGTIKRHGFHGGPKTHGQSDRWRAPGSIGQAADPARVFKGTRMPGHLGHARHTARNLSVVKVDTNSNLLLIKGAVPGPNGSYLIIRKTNKVG